MSATQSALLDTSKIIVGASGSGKTVSAKAEVQQLLEQRRHVAIVDPTGVWWGMRSNAAGDGPGFDLPIFGGEHGDVPIRPTDGAAIARIIVEQRVSAIVDISGIDNSADWRWFMDDFVAALRKKPRGNFHLVLDEADEFAAQVVADDVGHRLRENLVWMAKRGRAKGFVPTYITQRTAEIAKAVISQVQTIVAHQLIAPTDQKSIDDYLKAHAAQDVRREVMTSLAGLEVGERWIYSPRLQILNRGTTPALTTFDSSRTPAPGEMLVEPRTLAQLDVSGIRAALASPNDDAAAASPADRDRVDELENELASTRAALAAAERRLIALLTSVQGIIETEIAGAMMRLGSSSADDAILHPSDANPTESESASGAPAIPAILRRAIGRGVTPCPPEQPPVPSVSGAAVRGRHAPKPSDGQSRSRSAPAPGNGSKPAAVGASPKAGIGVSPPSGDASVSSKAKVPGGAAKPLALLAGVYPAGMTRGQLAGAAGIKKSGSTMSAYLSKLRSAAMIEERDGVVYATELGARSIGEVELPPPAGPELARWWAQRVGAAQIVEFLISNRGWRDRAAIAAALGINPAGSTLSAYVSKLFTAGVVEKNGSAIRLAPSVLGDA